MQEFASREMLSQSSRVYIMESSNVMTDNSHCSHRSLVRKVQEMKLLACVYSFLIEAEIC